jgi:hypothetical protein
MAVGARPDDGLEVVVDANFVGPLADDPGEGLRDVQGVELEDGSWVRAVETYPPIPVIHREGASPVTRLENLRSQSHAPIVEDV